MHMETYQYHSSHKTKVVLNTYRSIAPIRTHSFQSYGEYIVYIYRYVYITKMENHCLTYLNIAST